VPFALLRFVNAFSRRRKLLSLRQWLLLLPNCGETSWPSSTRTVALSEPTCDQDKRRPDERPGRAGTDHFHDLRTLPLCATCEIGSQHIAERLSAWLPRVPLHPQCGRQTSHLRPGPPVLLQCHQLLVDNRGVQRSG